MYVHCANTLYAPYQKKGIHEVKIAEREKFLIRLLGLVLIININQSSTGIVLKVYGEP